MVELLVNNFTDEESELLMALRESNVQYQIVLDIGQWGIKPPYLVVDGVPLDSDRALHWVKEHGDE